MSTKHYSSNWERYWSDVNDAGLSIMWDVAPEDGVGLDWPNFSGRLDRELPLLHLGCGHGRQTKFFSRHFERVIGADISYSAIGRARREHDADNIEYRQIDGLDHHQARHLHAEIGDTNVFVRAVMHQLEEVDQPRFLRSALELIGDRGVLHLTELHSRSLGLFRPLTRLKVGVFGELKTVLDHDISPHGVDPERIESIIDTDTYEILRNGPCIAARKHLGLLSIPVDVKGWSMTIRKRRPSHTSYVGLPAPAAHASGSMSMSVSASSSVSMPIL